MHDCSLQSVLNKHPCTFDLFGGWEIAFLKIREKIIPFILPRPAFPVFPVFPATGRAAESGHHRRACAPIISPLLLATLLLNLNLLDCSGRAPKSAHASSRPRSSWLHHIRDPSSFLLIFLSIHKSRQTLSYATID